MEDEKLKWDQPFVQFGLGAFETMRCINGVIPLLDYHFSRLSRALTSWDKPEFSLKERWSIRKKELPLEGQFRVKWIIGCDAELNIIDQLYCFPYQAPPQKLKCLLLPNPFTQVQQYKSTSYDQHWLANKNALKNNCHDAIYINVDGDLNECSRATLLLIEENSGSISEGQKLRSVSADALIAKHPEFWASNKITLNKINHKQTLWACNALHGLQMIESIVSPEGETLFQQKCDLSIQIEWNQLLFQASR